MDALFENNYVRNEKFIKEVNSYWFLRRPMIIAFDVLMAIYLIFGIISLKWIYILLPILWVAVQLYLYNANVKTAINRDKEVSVLPIELTVFVRDEEIYQKSSTGSEVHIKYTDMKRGFTTPNYICVMTKARQIVSFKKDGFAKGDEVALRLFLQSKGVKM